MSLNLENPAQLGPLRISNLHISLNGLKFPIDLSGGASRFRHRQGLLDSLRVEAPLKAIIDYATPLVRGALGWKTCHLSLFPAELGLVVGVHNGKSALAFSILFAPEDQDLRVIVADARGYDLTIHSHALAVNVVHALLGRHGQCAGGTIVVPEFAKRLVREVLIDAGARAPDTTGLCCTQWVEFPEGLALDAQRDASPLLLPNASLRAVEAARLCEQADDLLLKGQLDHARRSYMVALERAPRHPVIARRIAEIDLLTDQRPEAALATLIEAMPAVSGGALAAALLSKLGDQDGAYATLRHAVEYEIYPPLASLMLCDAAQHVSQSYEAISCLDEAVARTPSLNPCRWARAAARLRMGDVSGAGSDLAHIEAATMGSPDRFDVCTRAGHLMLDRREPEQSARFFEKALRYSPSSVEATAGLAKSLFLVGHRDRAISLLSRAVSQLTRSATSSHPLVLGLACALVDVANDIPAAIAHARSVPFGIVETVEARALEGRWRSMLGDIEGAAHAYGLAREASESLPAVVQPNSADWLVEAAHFCSEFAQDNQSAQRHLYAALRIRPNDQSIQMQFRSVATRNHEAARLAKEPELQSAIAESIVQQQVEDAAPTPKIAQSPNRNLEELASDQEGSLNLDEAEAEAEIEALTSKVRANPNDFAAVSTLAKLLCFVERWMDLFALVSGRLEESTDDEERAQLTKVRTQALRGMAELARREGREDEAAMYEEMLGEEASN